MRVAKMRARGVRRATRGTARREAVVRARDDAPKRADRQWWLYVLRCGDGSLYCGITTDVVRRLGMHEKGIGARYTRGRGPLVLLRVWSCEGMSAALKAEVAFKALSRKMKEERLAEV